MRCCVFYILFVVAVISYYSDNMPVRGAAVFEGDQLPATRYESGWPFLCQTRCDICGGSPPLTPVRISLSWPECAARPGSGWHWHLQRRRRWVVTCYLLPHIAIHWPRKLGLDQNNHGKFTKYPWWLRPLENVCCDLCTIWDSALKWF